MLNGKQLRVSVAKKNDKSAGAGGVAPMAHSSAAPAYRSQPAGPAAGAFSGPGPHTTLYVAGVPKFYTSEDLASLFSAYGTPSDARVLRQDDPSQKNAIGFVRLDSVASAQAAIDALNNAVPPRGTDPLMVKFKVSCRICRALHLVESSKWWYWTVI